MNVQIFSSIVSTVLIILYVNFLCVVFYFSRSSLPSVLMFCCNFLQFLLFFSFRIIYDDKGNEDFRLFLLYCFLIAIYSCWLSLFTSRKFRRVYRKKFSDRKAKRKDFSQQFLSITRRQLPTQLSRLIR